MSETGIPLYPLPLMPAYKDYIWGGDRIPRRYQRDLPPGRYAESWEFSDRSEGVSVVADGPLRGRRLDELLAQYGADLVGADVATERFPLLIKLIDARERLSVQVHPNDMTAPLTAGEPKTEAWYVLAADADAAVYAGFKPGTDEQALRSALLQGRVADLLERHAVRPGDLIYIPGGLVHAIGAGCLLLEVQQNSNTTYRVYDWDRVGADGSPRELHLEQALRVINWTARPRVIRPGPATPGERRRLLETPYFQLERLAPEGAGIPLPDQAQALFLANGQAVLRTVGRAGDLVMRPGTSLLLPAVVAGNSVAAVSEPPVELLRITWQL
ncbi:MAG: type I phosphomannose isomerase catalytic subunit [Kiritimatiellia bacterium]|nr:class I mannose-6-phosphate isomerase [Lentisphaerota bacterium]